MIKHLPLALIAFILISACKSPPPPAPPPPPPAEMPFSLLVYEGITAESPDQLAIIFQLQLNNPRPAACSVTVESWQAEINGHIIDSGLLLEMQNTPSGFPVSPVSAAVFPVVLNIDMQALAEEAYATNDEYDLVLSMSLKYSWDDDSHVHEVSGIANFPGIKEPVFRITAIAILKAELVNTRFRVGLRIDNPNPFPMELSAFSYVLYGNGRLWADGTERNIISLPAKSAVQGNLFLMMNFIDMRRDLLDQIINLQDVNYRFSGEAQVSTGVFYLPVFSTSFDLSGYSQVFDN